MGSISRVFLFYLIFSISSFSIACPTDMVLVEGFCIDKYEASLGASAQAVSVPGVFPIVNVSQIDADAACQQAGKRLCTDQEWLRACRGPDNYIYPYGNTLEPGTCNDLGAMAHTGSFPGCASVEGAFDMVGNAGEWTADPTGTLRGGYFADIAFNGSGCLYSTTAYNTSHSDDRTGFRCCSDNIVLPAYKIISIDIKPGSDLNSINLGSSGVIPVAILSTDDFNALAVNPASVSLAGASVKMVGKSDKYLCHNEDVNGDTLIDLVCQVYTAQYIIEAGETSATLEAETIGGVKLRGEDFVRIVPD